ncbi:MAG: Lrp/AsnC family transcriptional regulator [Pseudomonadota bacterium]
MLTDLEKLVIASLQGNIPVAERPYKVMAEALGITEEDFLAVVKDLDDRGMIRRFGATLKHQKSGYTANAMVAWKVPEDRVQEVGEIMASFDEVTHCYRRSPAGTWPYNLYTMVHACDEKTCHDIAHRISLAVSVNEYSLLFSRRELKKTSMSYFSD